MATDNNNNGYQILSLEDLANYYSSYVYPYQYHNTQQLLYPNVQPQQQQHTYDSIYLQRQQWLQQELQLQQLQLLQRQAVEEEVRREELKREIIAKLMPVIKEEEEEDKEEDLQWEHLDQNIVDLCNDVTINPISHQRFVSFLKTDNSFLTPWSWNADDAPVNTHDFSSFRRMMFEEGSFFSDIPVFSPEAQKSRHLSEYDDGKGGHLSEIEERKSGHLSGTDDMKSEHISEIDDKENRHLSEFDESSDQNPKDILQKDFAKFTIVEVDQNLPIDQDHNLPRSDVNNMNALDKMADSFLSKMDRSKVKEARVTRGCSKNGKKDESKENVVATRSQQKRGLPPRAKGPGLPPRAKGPHGRNT